MATMQAQSERRSSFGGIPLDDAPTSLRSSGKTRSGRGLGLRNITNLDVSSARKGGKKPTKLTRTSTVVARSTRATSGHGSSNVSSGTHRAQTIPIHEDGVSKALRFPETSADTDMNSGAQSAKTSAADRPAPFTECFVDDSDEDMGASDGEDSEHAAVAPDAPAATPSEQDGMVPVSDALEPSMFHSDSDNVAAMRAELLRLREENDELREIVERHAPKHVEISSEVYSVRNHTVTPVKLERSLSVHTAAVLARSQHNKPKRSELVKNMVMLFSHRQGYEKYVQTRSFAQDLTTLARLAAQCMSKEERLLSLQSPIYIFGDIHGNLKDLHFFSDNLWKFGVNLTAGKFLFLGDYVDRGQQSLEVVAYLFALKLSAPDKFFLIRGNHELRKVNGWEEWYKSGSFKWQCKNRFGDAIGTQVWEEINCTFDCMPLAAVVDDSIFCCHGGIPRPLPGMTHSPAPSTATRTPIREGGRRGSLGIADGNRRVSVGSEGAQSPGGTPGNRRTSLLETPRPGRPSRRHHDRRLDAIRAVPCPISLSEVHEDTLNHAATVGQTAPANSHSAASSQNGGVHLDAERSSRSHRSRTRPAAAMTPGSRAAWVDNELTPELIQRVALDMLWADPAADEAEDALGGDGFGPGLRGGDTVQYGNRAIEEFLDGNGLQLIVRAHQAISTGIGICKSAKVFTVFSTSKDHGCGSTATCGCLLVENGKILPIMRAPQRSSSSSSSGQRVRSSPTAAANVMAPGHGQYGPQPGASSHQAQRPSSQHHSHSGAGSGRHGHHSSSASSRGIPRAPHSSHSHSGQSTRRLSRSASVRVGSEPRFATVHEGSAGVHALR